MAQTYGHRSASDSRNMRLNKVSRDATSFNYGDAESIAALAGTDFSGYSGQDYTFSYVPVSSGRSLSQQLQLLRDRLNDSPINKPISDVDPTGATTQKVYDDVDLKAKVDPNGHVQTGDMSHAIEDLRADINDLNENWINRMFGTFGDALTNVSNGFGEFGSQLAGAIGAGQAQSAGALSSGFGQLADAQIQSSNDIMNMIRQTTAENNAWSAAEAQKNRDWQERLSNTAHQREVADLKAAGLNPVLSANGGSGAPVGSGAVAQGDSSNTRLLTEVAMQALETAQESARGVSRMATDGVLGKLLNSRIMYGVGTGLGRSIGFLVGKAIPKILGA